MTSYKEPCMYCLKSGIRVEKLYDWSNPNKYNWYCQEHWYVVRQSQEIDKEQFFRCYEDEYRRKWISGRTLKLFWKLKKEIDGDIK